MSQEVGASIVESVHHVAGAVSPRPNFEVASQLGVVCAPANRQRLLVAEVAVVGHVPGELGREGLGVLRLRECDVLLERHNFFSFAQPVKLGFVVLLTRSKTTQLVLHLFVKARVESIFRLFFQQGRHRVLAPAAWRLRLPRILRAHNWQFCYTSHMFFGRKYLKVQLWRVSPP